jgi:hypothetical protein
VFVRRVVLTRLLCLQVSGGQTVACRARSGKSTLVRMRSSGFMTPPVVPSPDGMDTARHAAVAARASPSFQDTVLFNDTDGVHPIWPPGRDSRGVAPAAMLCHLTYV